VEACTRIPGLVREHRADKANDDIRNSALTKGCVLKTRRIPRTLSALLLVELSIQGFYWIFATLAHAQNKSWCSRTNPDTRVPVFMLRLSQLENLATLWDTVASVVLVVQQYDRSVLGSGCPGSKDLGQRLLNFNMTRKSSPCIIWVWSTPNLSILNVPRRLGAKIHIFRCKL